jgi:hypothetical protein
MWFNCVRVALANFLPWGPDLLHCVGGLGVLGWHSIIFCHGALFAALCMWFKGVRVALANFLPWGPDLPHCVGGVGVLWWT